MTLEFIPDGHVTSPKGYLAGAVYAGLKTYGENKLDLGLLASEWPCTAAGVFTQSTVQGAPVIISRRHLADGRARGIVVNSGCSNVCTGEQGLDDAVEMASLAGARIGCDPHLLVVASTGVIGRLLPMDKIRSGLPTIELTAAGGEALSRAIMTTDTRPKRIAAAFTVDGVRYTVGGIAKGSGMIHPDMATMFGFLTTDANVDRSFVDRVLRAAADQTFNMVSVDNDTSTSDTVTLFANGAAGEEPITEDHPAAPPLQEAVTAVARHLAREIARDGEGATKLIEIRVTGAVDEAQARRAARTISASPLVKSAVYGNDPNWGRIMMAVGRSRVEVDLARVQVAIGAAVMYADGRPQQVEPEVSRAALAGPEVTIHADLGVGSAGATAWGCDLTEEYVKINAEYTT